MNPDVVFVFVDGLGLGSGDPAENPLATDRYPGLARLAGSRVTVTSLTGRGDADHLAVPIDANLGLDGLPQSGTGQASLFTGVNCSELAGRHYGPFPHSTSKSVIAHRNVFAQLLAAGQSVQFANPYPQRFFTYVERTGRWTVTTLCCLEAGVPLKRGTDLKRGKAVPADITGENWPEPSAHIRPVAPEVAGKRLAKMTKDARFTLFEYFATDKAGHSMSHDRAHRALARVDGLVAGLLDELDLSRQSVILTSDHGNIEDLSVKTHTRNPVPLLVRGPASKALAGAKDLTDVTPGLVEYFRRSA